MYKIDLDLSGLIAAGGVITNAVMPTVHQAIGTIASVIEQDWKEHVLRAGGSGGLYAAERDAYASSITWTYTSDFSAVVSASYKPAKEIEEGRPARDLKKMLNTSMKTRVSKTGKRYLIIPFRHNTPGMSAHASPMPQDIYSLAKKLAPSKVTGVLQVPNQLGVHSVRTRGALLVSRNQYQWGDRLPPGLKPKLKPHHATDIYAGMTRFDTSSGGAKSSAYMTFRMMVEGSSKWVIPARPGLYILKGVVERADGVSEHVLGQAMKALM